MLVKNKKGDVAVVLVVIMAFLLVGIAMFSFSTASNAYSTEISNPNDLDEIYLKKYNYEYYITNSLENAYLLTYNDFVKNNFYFPSQEKKYNYTVFDKEWNEEERFEEKFTENFNKEIDKYIYEGLRSEDIKLDFRDDEIIARIENFNTKNVLDEAEEKSFEYNASIEVKFSSKVFGLHSFKEISNVVQKCKSIAGANEKKECYEKDLSNFYVYVQIVRRDMGGNIISEFNENTQVKEVYSIVSLISKNKYLYEKEDRLVNSNIEYEFIDMKI